jgi:GNAT superfamily N-acetyltransferase
MTPEVLQRPFWSPPRSAELAAQIARSDARYFSLGASLTPLPGAILAVVEGLTALPAACVTIVLDGDAAGVDARGWVREAEAATREHGGGICRIYLDAPAPALELELAAVGYERRVEDIFLTPPGPAPAAGSGHLVPVEGDLWALARELHASDAVAPDGYAASPEDWWELMRRKQEAGGMECYIVEADGRPCGTIGIVPMPDVLRIKNVFVAPQARGNGAGRAAVAAVWRSAAERGLSGAGVLGVRDTPGAALYARAGLRTAGALIEWSRTLGRS